MNAHLGKPINFDELMGTVRQFLPMPAVPKTLVVDDEPLAIEV